MNKIQDIIEYITNNFGTCSQYINEQYEYYDVQNKTDDFVVSAQDFYNCLLLNTGDFVVYTRDGCISLMTKTADFINSYQFKHELFENSVIVYSILCSICLLRMSMLLYNQHKDKTINIYLDRKNESEFPSKIKKIGKDKDVVYLRSKISFLKDRLDEISKIIDNEHDRVCKKIPLIKNELMKRFIGRQENLQIKN